MCAVGRTSFQRNTRPESSRAKCGHHTLIVPILELREAIVTPCGSGCVSSKGLSGLTKVGIMIMHTRDTVWMNGQPEHKMFESMRQNTKKGNAS